MFHRFIFVKSLEIWFQTYKKFHTIVRTSEPLPAGKFQIFVNVFSFIFETLLDHEFATYKNQSFHSKNCGHPQTEIVETIVKVDRSIFESWLLVLRVTYKNQLDIYNQLGVDTDNVATTVNVERLTLDIVFDVKLETYKKPLSSNSRWRGAFHTANVHTTVKVDRSILDILLLQLFKA